MAKQTVTEQRELSLNELTNAVEKIEGKLGREVSLKFQIGLATIDKKLSEIGIETTMEELALAYFPLLRQLEHDNPVILEMRINRVGQFVYVTIHLLLVRKTAAETAAEGNLPVLDEQAADA